MAIRSSDLDTLRHAGIGPGAVLVDVDPLTPANFLEILKGTVTAPNTGRHIGGMTAAPSFADSDETTDRTENLVGVNVDMVGAHQIQRVTTTLTVEIAKMTLENFKLIRPDYVEEDWMSGGATPTKVGTRLRRSGRSRREHYLKNVVMILPVEDATFGYAFVVENALNRSDDAEHSPNDDGNVYGVSCEFRAHSDGGTMDPESGDFPIPAEILKLDLPTIGG